ncbi:MAG: cation transporter [Pseudomonadota bacterium]|nr:MAG: cation transporter [Pseudomonadota bacterium]
MSGCCNHGDSLALLRERQRGTLHVVFAINAVMFFIIVAAAWAAHSSALLADSLDNFGDAFTYAISLYAVARGRRTKARVALLKGGLILLAAAVVAAQIVYRLFVPATPVFELMGAFSLVALAANATCLFLLMRHRDDDVNMNSVWECSRNDIVANLSVFAAAAAVWATGSAWPDLLVAGLLVLFLLRSALRVMARAGRELRQSA